MASNPHTFEPPAVASRLIDQIVEAVGSVVGNAPRPVALHEPRFAGRETRYTRECIDTGWVSSAGSFVDRFERDLAAFTKAKHAVVTVNGTAALHMALLLAGVEPGDEVIIPALTFVATANAVSHCGATPHLADSEQRTLGMDARKLAAHLEQAAELKVDSSRPELGEVCVNRVTGRRIAAVVPMHAFGHPVEFKALQSVCDRWNLPIVEDAAESLGSLYHGRHTGTMGRLGVLSFNGNKIITTGGGGAILTNDSDLAARAKHLTTTAKLPHPWRFDHDAVAFNYRLPNLNAALGCAQLEQLPGFVESKRALALRYAAAIAPVRGVRFVDEPPDCRSNYWLNTMLLDASFGDDDQQLVALLAALHEAGIMARPAWTPMHQLPMYRDCPRMDLSVAESLARRIVNLPGSVKLEAGR